MWHPTPHSHNMPQVKMRSMNCYFVNLELWKWKNQDLKFYFKKQTFREKQDKLN